LFRVLVKKKADLAKALFFFRKNQTQTQTKHVRALINDKIIINIGPPYHREEEKKFGGDKRDQGESASLFFFSRACVSYKVLFTRFCFLRDLFSLLSL